jgi:hypothetical protein
MRKLRNRASDIDRGRALAAWLNAKNRLYTSRVEKLIRWWLSLKNDPRSRRVSFRRRAQVAFALGMLGAPLPEDAEKGSSWPIRMRVEFRPDESGLGCQIVPEDEPEDDKMLYFFAALLNSGNASRLIICPNCEKVWYQKKRNPRARACSTACRVALWQKTPEGRKARAAYMRKHRADLREMKRKPVKITKEMIKRRAIAR